MLGTILLSLWLTLLAAPASAHDTLIDSSPAEGEVLTEVPSALELTYSGEISDLGVQFMVTGPDDRDVVQGTPTVEGAVVTQELAEELVNGDYEVAWRVTSSDGHPISGLYAFTIEAPEEPGETQAPEETGATATDTSDPAGESATPAPGAAGDAAGTTTSPAPAVTPDAATTTAPEAAATTASDSSNGIPGWGWLVAALAAVGLVACGFLAFRRH